MQHTFFIRNKYSGHIDYFSYTEGEYEIPQNKFNAFKEYLSQHYTLTELSNSELFISKQMKLSIDFSED